MLGCEKKDEETKGKGYTQRHVGENKNEVEKIYKLDTRNSKNRKKYPVVQIAEQVGVN